MHEICQSIRRTMLLLTAIAGWLVVILALLGPSLFAQQPTHEDRFRDQILPLLTKYCYDCHANGESEGKVSLEVTESVESLLADKQRWWAVLKNVRSDIMPPRDQPHPAEAEKNLIARWIMEDVLELDPANPDPGRVTLRRLNRIEYRNTIRDLLGVEFDTEVEFPPDDSGHGFDNIGDVLSLSPLLVEKYLAAAEAIVSQAIPTVSRVIPSQSLSGNDFTNADKSKSAESISFYERVSVTKKISIAHPGEYILRINSEIDGEFDFDPGRCRITFMVDGSNLLQREFGWQATKSLEFRLDASMEPGEHELSLGLEPLVAESERKNQLDFELKSVAIEGPIDHRYWVHPENYSRFFSRDEPPAGLSDRFEYAAQILQDFASRAFRRPVDQATLNKLVDIATSPSVADKTESFESGIARAITYVLVSPRFLFRTEKSSPELMSGQFPHVDEFALASRLSYFLWSTIPDQDLWDTAKRGQLRENLHQQIERMIHDPRSDEFVKHFIGQWLQARDVEGVSIDPLAASGLREEYDLLREKERPLRNRRDDPALDLDPEIKALRARIAELRTIRETLNPKLRTAMRRESEMHFEHIMRTDQSVLDFLVCDYAFLNSQLAEHYGIRGVEGDELRRVSLPPESHRGGVLTQGNFLMVTSNPTRTSPVKRGLFILESILGTPPPPAPGNVPELEDAAKSFGDHPPTLREALELHRRESICSSCHARFDPLGLGLENFNALGKWRDAEAGKPIDASGQLITGETFVGVAELKRILRNERRADFYRCLTERLLTYALGRGLEYYDEQTVSNIVSKLESSDGRFSTLLLGIIDSAPFQKHRPSDNR